MTINKNLFFGIYFVVAIVELVASIPIENEKLIQHNIEHIQIYPETTLPASYPHLTQTDDTSTSASTTSSSSNSDTTNSLPKFQNIYKIGSYSSQFDGNGGPHDMLAVEKKNFFADDATAASKTITTTSIPNKLMNIECTNSENSHKGEFSISDYAIVGGMLIISLGIGIFYGFFTKSTNTSAEFLLGSGMSLIPVTLSLTTSFITAIELLGNPSEMFYNGTQFSLIVIPMILVIPIAIKIFYPIYYNLNLTSCYEYLGIRFGKEIRIMGAILYIIQMSFYTAVAVLAPAIALSAATGLNTRLAVVLIYLVCIFYSSQGGLKAVVIADTFQACVLAFSLVLIVILGYFYSGTFKEIFETSASNDRLEFFNLSPDPRARHTVFSVVIGGFFYWTSLFCTNQASVQKCMSLKSLKLAQLAITFAITGLIVVFLLNFYTGLMVFTHYSKCDPLQANFIQATDQLLPYYIMDTYSKIETVTGIFVAGIFAASLGTVASALNSLAAVTLEDLINNGLNVKLAADQQAKYAKWMSLGYGLFSFVLVFIVERLGGVLQATLTLNGLIGGVTLGLFILGIAFKRANTKGAFYGGLLALLIVVFIGIMAQITQLPPKYLKTSIENCNCTNNILDLTTTSNQNQSHLLSSSITAEALISSPSAIAALPVALLPVAAARTTDESSLLSRFVMTNDQHQQQEPTMNNHNTAQNGFSFTFTAIYQISYMWYSMLGAILTITFGLIISIIYDAVQKHNIIQITTKQ